MNRVALIGPTLLLAATTLQAQSANGPESQALILRHADTGSACPIAMHARHEFSTQRELTKGTPPRDMESSKDGGVHAALTLTLTDPHNHSITAATITIHGTNGKWQVVPASSIKGFGDVSKTMNVLFEPGENRSVDSHLVAPGFTSITSIVLDSVTYANGETWKTIDQGACRIAPDPMMLVAAH